MSVLAHESAEPVTDRRQLIGYFTQAAKPKTEWLIGVEHEKFPYRLSTLKPVGYSGPQGLRDLFEGLREFGWQPVMEGENLIGLSRGASTISFEPGGQVELGGAPWRTLHEAAGEIDRHLAEVNGIGEKLGIGFLGIGFHPAAARSDIEWVPKERYRIMRGYMPKKGLRGIDMMIRTCTVQVNLDFADETDMVRKMRVGLALQPLATALFASSPLVEGKPNGYLSNRMRCWQDTDPDRSGPLPLAFEGFGYERYVDYALDVPMYFVWREGKYVDCAGQSFRDFMDGKLPALPGLRPTMLDWANHLTTLFPDVRLKKVIEMRGADMGSLDMLMALPAFWTGLLYDPAACDAAWNLVRNWSAEDRLQLHREVPRLGLKAAIAGRPLLEVAKEAVSIARQGLRRRGEQLHGGADETRYLDPLFDIAEKGRSRAEQLLMQFENVTAAGMQGVFESARLLTEKIEHKASGH